MSIWSGWKLRSLIMAAAALLIAQPLMAQRVFAPVGDGNERPSLGYARPPIFVIGNASAAPYGLAPQRAALFAIANSMRAAAGKAALSSTNTIPYNRAKTNFAVDFHDVTSGTDGTCGSNCTAAPKYDFVTGLGTPQANNLIPALVSQ